MASVVSKAAYQVVESAIKHEGSLFFLIYLFMTIVKKYGENTSEDGQLNSSELISFSSSNKDVPSNIQNTFRRNEA